MNAYVIEATLLRWADNHNGRTVTLQLPHEGDHPFRGLPCGPANGQRMAVSVALISDDETKEVMQDQPRHTQPAGGSEPHKTPPRPPSDTLLTAPAGGAKKSWGDMTLSQQTGVLRNDPLFIKFLHHKKDYSVASPANAAKFIREYCSVDSCSHIVVNTNSGLKWSELLSEYRAWQREPEVVP